MSSLLNIQKDNNNRLEYSATVYVKLIISNQMKTLSVITLGNIFYSCKIHLKKFLLSFSVAPPRHPSVVAIKPIKMTKKNFFNRQHFILFYFFFLFSFFLSYSSQNVYFRFLETVKKRILPSFSEIKFFWSEFVKSWNWRNKFWILQHMSS